MMAESRTEDDVYDAILAECARPVDPAINLARCVIYLLRPHTGKGASDGRFMTKGLLLALALSRPVTGVELRGREVGELDITCQRWVHEEIQGELLGKTGVGE